MNGSRLILKGLSELDAEELSEALGADAEIVEPEVPEGTIAEPATISAIIMLSPLVIGALTVWMSKPRRSYLRKETMQFVDEKGRIFSKTLEIRASSEDEAQAQIAAEFTKWMTEIPKFGL